MNQRNTTQVLLFILSPLSTLSAQEKLPHFMRWLISLPFWVLPTIKQSFHLEKIRKHCIPGRPWKTGISCAEVFLVLCSWRVILNPSRGIPLTCPNLQWVLQPLADYNLQGWRWWNSWETRTQKMQWFSMSNPDFIFQRELCSHITRNSTGKEPGNFISHCLGIWFLLSNIYYKNSEEKF